MHPAPELLHRFPPGHITINPKNKKSKQRQLIEMQQVLVKVVTDEGTEPRDRAVCAVAWERLESRLGKLRMKPEPKAIDVTPKKRAISHVVENSFDPGD